MLGFLDKIAKKRRFQKFSSHDLRRKYYALTFLFVMPVVAIGIHIDRYALLDMVFNALVCVGIALLLLHFSFPAEHRGYYSRFTLLLVNVIVKFSITILLLVFLYKLKASSFELFEHLIIMFAALVAFLYLVYVRSFRKRFSQYEKVKDSVNKKLDMLEMGYAGIKHPISKSPKVKNRRK